MSVDQTELYRRFISSMTIGQEEWRDGTGYDLEALAALEGSWRTEAEKAVLRRGADDWRDIEALAVLATPAAIGELRKALKSPRRDLRLRAAQELHRIGQLDDLTPAIIDALGEADRDETVRSRVLDMIAWNQPTSPKVAARLLELLPRVSGSTAVHFAAMLFFLHGITKEAFDWSERPFFLRFNTADLAEREAALRELRARIGVKSGS